MNATTIYYYRTTDFPFERKTLGASGFDLYASLDGEGGDIEIEPLGRARLTTGIRLAMPLGLEAQIRPRSGLADKHGLVAVLGTIDADYRGDCSVQLVNLSNEGATVKHGDRVAQLVFVQVVLPDLQREISDWQDRMYRWHAHVFGDEPNLNLSITTSASPTIACLFWTPVATRADLDVRAVSFGIRVVDQVNWDQTLITVGSDAEKRQYVFYKLTLQQLEQAPRAWMLEPTRPSPAGPYQLVEVDTLDKLPPSKRGTAGWGSTGR